MLSPHEKPIDAFWKRETNGALETRPGHAGPSFREWDMIRKIVSVAAAAMLGCLALSAPMAQADEAECAAATNILANAMDSAKDTNSLQMLDILRSAFRTRWTPLLLQYGTEAAAKTAIEEKGRALGAAGGSANINRVAQSCIGNPALYSPTVINAALQRLPPAAYPRAASCAAYIARDSSTSGTETGGSGPALAALMSQAGNSFLAEAIRAGAAVNKSEAVVRGEILGARDSLMAAPRDNWRPQALACLAAANVGVTIPAP
jgi:hypothetical protein